MASALKALSALQLDPSHQDNTDGDHSLHANSEHAMLSPHSAQKIVKHEESFHMITSQSFLVSGLGQRLHTADSINPPPPVIKPTIN